MANQYEVIEQRDLESEQDACTAQQQWINNNVDENGNVTTEQGTGKYIGSMIYIAGPLWIIIWIILHII